MFLNYKPYIVTCLLQFALETGFAGDNTWNGTFVSQGIDKSTAIEVGYVDNDDIYLFAMRTPRYVYIYESIPPCHGNILSVNNDSVVVSSMGCGSGIEMKILLVAINRHAGEIAIVDSLDPVPYEPLFKILNGRIASMSLSNTKAGAWGGQWGWMLPEKIDLEIRRQGIFPRIFMEKRGRPSLCNNLSSCLLEDLEKWMFDYDLMKRNGCKAFSRRTKILAKESGVDICSHAIALLEHLPKFSTSGDILVKKFERADNVRESIDGK